jgi:hypothetical protein
MTSQNASPSSHRFGTWSIILMFLPVTTIVLMNVVISPLFGKIPGNVEYLIAILGMLLPAILGFIFALAGLVKKESRKWVHWIGFVVNLLQSVFFGVFALLAG